MFETNTDFDFDDASLTSSFKNSQKSNPAKRPSDPPSDEAPKKPKTLLVGRRARPAFNSSDFPRNVVKRKFPGPAGILPDCKNVDLSVLEQSSAAPNDEIPCTQTSLSVFQEEPWVRMSEDFEAPLREYDIRWIKTRASSNRLVNQKAPFLAAVVQGVECFDGKLPIVNVVLKDMTGEIQGTIIHSLYEQHCDNLTAGSVIVLKQFGVLTTGYNNNHYLTITPNNLVMIYARIKGEGEEVEEVKKIAINSLSFEETVDPAENSKQNYPDSSKPVQNCNRLQKELVQDRNSLSFESIMDNLRRNQSGTSRPVEDCPKKPVQDGSRLQKKPVDSFGFEDDFHFPDDLENVALRSETDKFKFKSAKVRHSEVPKDVTVSCSQVSVRASQEHSEIWKSALEGVDADSLFDDF